MDEESFICCPECTEWFDVWFSNTIWTKLQFCPLCGHEFTDEELEKMKEEQG